MIFCHFCICIHNRPFKLRYFKHVDTFELYEKAKEIYEQTRRGWSKQLLLLFIFTVNQLCCHIELGSWIHISKFIYTGHFELVLSTPTVRRMNTNISFDTSQNLRDFLIEIIHQGYLYLIKLLLGILPSN